MFHDECRNLILPSAKPRFSCRFDLCRRHYVAVADDRGGATFCLLKPIAQKHDFRRQADCQAVADYLLMLLLHAADAAARYFSCQLRARVSAQHVMTCRDAA